MFDKEYIAHRRESNGEIQNLSLHLEEVSQKAWEFSSKIGLKECGEIIGLLHDLGKASDEFERYIKSAVGLIDSDDDDYIDASEKKGKVDHSSAGAQLIFRNIANKGVAQALSRFKPVEFDGFKRENLRDHMDDFELIFTMMGERATTEIHRTEDSQGVKKLQADAHAGGSIAGDARKALEKRLKKPIVSSRNYLKEKESRKKIEE